MPDATASESSATLTYPGGEHHMEITHASGGADGIGLGKLLAETGLITLDPGFVNTAACSSEICFIDGAAAVTVSRPGADPPWRGELARAGPGPHPPDGAD